MTMTKENVATCSRLSPKRIPVAMVVPERLRPGRTARACPQPITKESRQVRSGFAQNCLYVIFQKDTHNTYGDAAHQYLADVDEVRASVKSEKSAQQPFEHGQQYDYCGEDSGCMYHHVELQRLVCGQVYAEYLAEDGQMAAGAYGQVFRSSLHNAQYKR